MIFQKFIFLCFGARTPETEAESMMYFNDWCNALKQKKNTIDKWE